MTYLISVFFVYTKLETVSKKRDYENSACPETDIDIHHKTSFAFINDKKDTL